MVAFGYGHKERGEFLYPATMTPEICGPMLSLSHSNHEMLQHSAWNQPYKEHLRRRW